MTHPNVGIATLDMSDMENSLMIERSYCRQIEEQNPGGQVHNIFHLNVVISLFGQTSQQQSCQVIWSNIQVIRHMFITLVH